MINYVQLIGNLDKVGKLKEDAICFKLDNIVCIAKDELARVMNILDIDSTISVEGKLIVKNHKTYVFATKIENYTKQSIVDVKKIREELYANRKSKRLCNEL